MAVPRFSTCHIPECGSPSVRGRGCSHCHRHLCSYHLMPPTHMCSQMQIDDASWEKQIHDEVAALLSKVNIKALLKQVADIVGDRTDFTFEPGRYLGAGAVMGCANYHGWIRFGDGKRWIVRIPRASYSDVPDTLVEYLVSSEFATLKFLESTKVPAPRAYTYELASNPGNAVGVSYILMDALPGTPYDIFQATLEQQDRVLEQLADILIELSKYPIPRGGSFIQRRDGAIEISSYASNRFLALHPYGPSNDALAYFIQTAEQHLDLIADHQLYPEYAAEAFKFYTILREHAHLLHTHEEPNTFFLKHVDDKGDHLLIDEKGNITGIIDWQFARCVPASESFGPSYVTSDLDALYAGRVELTTNDRNLARALRERGAENIAMHMERDVFARTFSHGLASGLAKDEIRTLIANVIASLQSRGVWLQETMAKLSSDPRWLQIRSHDGNVGACN